MRSQHRTRPQIEASLLELRGGGRVIESALLEIRTLGAELDLAIAGVNDAAEDANARLVQLYRARDLMDAARQTLDVAKDLSILALMMEASESEREITRDELAVYEEKTGGGS